MKVSEAIQNIRTVQIAEKSSEVIHKVVAELKSINPGLSVEVLTGSKKKSSAGNFTIATADLDVLGEMDFSNTENIRKPFIYLRIDGDGSGCLAVSDPMYLYAFFRDRIESPDEDIEEYTAGKIIHPAFDWNRLSYDFFLTQEGRIQRHFEPADYIRDAARLGFTHVEVNGLAYPMGLETGPKGEVYPMFYTYCPALDQFVHSELNKGLYPPYYLAANLKYLKENARLAVSYGLTPGLLSFEPRSVPEKFFDKYPMLRGGRIDHPFRSFKPRYNMTITHPKVRAHYAEMMSKLMDEVPELGFMDIWTNDSGAGFEHTKSLYVGRNGGAYMIREWKDDAEIAKIAGENALRFFNLLKDTAAEVNKDFRVITRLESFYGEHDTVWNGMGNNLDVETNSLVTRGWDMPYSHPRYPDMKEINGGSVYQTRFDDGEVTLMNELRERKGEVHFYFAAGPHTMFEPLLGVPSPGLTWKRLKMLHDNGVKSLSHIGGTFPAAQVPFNVNHEISRVFQYKPNADLEEVLSQIAEKWAGHELAGTLLKVWELTEDAIFAFPNISTLYSSLGFSWYRLWVRPFVPNIEAIPQAQRDYYEDFMCTTPHNPNNIDLSRDVLFQLTTPEKSRLCMDRIDQNLWPPLDAAIALLAESEGSAKALPGEHNIIHDQFIRLRALRCWFMTQRNIAAWVVGVYVFMSSESAAEKSNYKALLKDMMEKEIENTSELMKLLKSDVEFMALTDQGETPLIHGDNLAELLPRRIELMKQHMNDEPFIDHDYIERKAGEPVF